MIFMKINQNNVKLGDYYLGLDIGTASVGWAVTDFDYNILKFKGNAMWGVRLFEEAKGASERRSSRAVRRRFLRRKQRLLLLELLFSQEIAKIDTSFFVRLKESTLTVDDKTTSDKYLLFNDESYTDKDHIKKYPSIYHLRSELIHSKEPHDIRLVFLAMHHIIKNRGHFLLDMDTDGIGKTTLECLDDLNTYLYDNYEQNIEFVDRENYSAILETEFSGVNKKKQKLRELVKQNKITEGASFNPMVLSDLLAGATVKLSDLFCDDNLKNAEVKSFTLKSDIDEVFDQLSEILGEKIDLLLVAKSVFDAAKLTQILNGENFISDAKIKLYCKNHEKLKKLKEYVKTYYPQKYKEIFSVKKDKLNNYAAYSNNKIRSGGYHCNQEKFCSYLKSQLPDMKNNDLYKDIYEEIENKIFLTPLRGTENSVIPCKLHLKELEIILENASEYLDFLKVKDADGLTVAQKIISIFKFKVPYYVGPLNEKSPNSWVVRTGEKIYPWNFDKVVDKKKSAEQFIINLIGRCSYTGDYVLPKDSLLYSEYMLRNELNLLRVNGKELPRDIMDELYNDLFVLVYKKITVKSIKNYLLSKGLIEETDELSGIDITIKSRLKSYHDFKRLLAKGISEDDVESIIQRVVIFSEDKKMLREWLKTEFPSLMKEDVDYICRLKYKEWGRLSKRFLTEIYHEDGAGNVFCIMDMLKLYNVNLSHLMSGEYQFYKEAEKIRKENTGGDISLSQQIDDMYISPAVKRSIRQTLKIIDEIVDIKKAAPKKIFIEVSRGTLENEKGKRKDTRKNKLIELYKKCGEESSDIFKKLCNEEENALRSDKLYLYYTQFGKCMYSGEIIDFDSLIRDNLTYDIDHIFPKSKVKDDSIDNRILVKKVLNKEKENIYPIKSEIREKMYPFWKALKDKGTISEKKFDRLIRQTPLTDKELSDFVARQIVETQQSTKAITSLLQEYYKNTSVVFSKAKNVTYFRNEFKFTKCREINDLHHAKDAYLNVVVGNVYKTKFTDKFFLNILNEKYSLNTVFSEDVPGAWKADGTSVSIVRKYMGKSNITVTRMPREVKGELFDLTIMPAGKGQLPIKKGLDIDKYGGYNKVSGAYYFIVEHTKKNKRIRTIETVMICDKDFYESNPLAYCVEKLDLSEPKIIVPVIRFDTLLELDGSKVYITGRTDGNYVCKHAYELAVDIVHEKYIKQIDKYINRCILAKKEILITEHEEITFEQNLELYEWFVQKLNCEVYKKLFKNMITDLNDNKTVFEKMSLYSQCKLLLEILKAFKCDRQTSNFLELNGKKTVGIIRFNKNISRMNSAYLINQSPTGLYEYKIDLLK